MTLFFLILFWTSVLLIFFSYVLFPLIISGIAAGKNQNTNCFTLESPDLPEVSILLAVYNEEMVIEQKLQSTFKTNYPLSKITFLIGSDSSSDNTDNIIEKYRQIHPQLSLKVFPKRTGKAGIVNQLEQLTSAKILILTDANVFFEEDTIFNLVKHYKNNEIGLVGGNIINQHLQKSGISIQEKTYLDRENKIKYNEGVLWGTMIGAFGGCYSIRKKLFTPVPPKYFMDDFFITMGVLASGSKAINELQARCYEDVSNKISEEFRRKVRISIGNYQNLAHYKKLLFSAIPGLSFSFWSHKVLRWMGPFFILATLISLLYLSVETPFYQKLLLLQLITFALPLLDELLKKSGLHIRLLRFISHFYLMNLALLIGFFRYISGVDSNVWKPTQRFQN